MYVKVTWAKKLMPQRAEVQTCRAAMATDMSYWVKNCVTNFREDRRLNGLLSSQQTKY